MRAKVGVWRLALWAATFIGATGLLVGVPEQAIGQATPAQSTQQSAELAEAERLNQQVEQLYKQGQYSAAIPLAERSLAIREKVLGLEHPDVAQSLNNLALLYKAQGNYSEAEPLFQRSLAIQEKVLGPEHPDVAQSYNNLAALYQAQGDIVRTLEFLTRGTNIEERNLALIFTTGSEARKRDYIATLSGRTDATLSLHVQDAPNNTQANRLALTTILRRKGRVLDALTDSLQTLRQNLEPEDQASLDELAATRSQLAALFFKGAENLPTDEYRQQVADLKAKAEQQEATLSRRSAQFRVESQPVSIEAVQQSIPTEAALVELVLYEPFNPKPQNLTKSGVLRATSPTSSTPKANPNGSI